MDTVEQPPFSLLTLVTQAAASPGGFQWAEAYPAMVGAGIGGVVAISAAVGTQIWQGRRSAAESREKQLQDAIGALMTAIGDEVAHGPTKGLIGVTAAAFAARGWAIRAGYGAFADTMTDLHRRAINADAMGDRRAAVEAMTATSQACAWWVANPSTFGRRTRAPESLKQPLTADDVMRSIKE